MKCILFLHSPGDNATGREKGVSEFDADEAIPGRQSEFY